MRRAAAVVVVVAACASPGSGPDVRTPDKAAVVVPGTRLPDALAPLAYDLTLELDPDRPTFHGHVEIRVRAAAATDALWLHAVDLRMIRATASDPGGEAALVPLGDGEQMRGFRLPHAVAAGAELTLAFDYQGETTGDQEGLFRQQVGQRWYLYSQSESVFARRILPCFDEPRWKPTWRVTLVVPRGQEAFGNAPEVSRRERDDGRTEIALAPTPPMPSYLVAVAAGPFDVADLGAIGRAHVPVRAVVPAGERGRTEVLAQQLPAIVAALEAYFDAPLPVAKLDLVGVPRFFGGMENPGLITFIDGVLLPVSGDPSGRRTLQKFLAHELAHLWLGDSVTPAWWDDLWLAEAFATWLGDKVIAGLDGFDDEALRRAETRELAFDADGVPAPRALRRPVVHGEDAEGAFDAIAYDKGAAVLATLEQALGAPAMQALMRAYVRAHADGTATSADFVAAVDRADPRLQPVLRSYIDTPGAPVVELALACAPGRAALATHVRAPATAVAMCVRYPTAGGAAEACGVAGGTLPLPAASGCPAWIIPNAGGVGYYATVWTDGRIAAPGPVTPAEQLAAGMNLAGAIDRGEVALPAALAELSRLAALPDPYAVVAALALARAITPLVEPAFEPRWDARLVTLFASRVTPDALLAPATPADRAARDRLLELVPGERLPAAAIERASAELDRLLAGDRDSAGMSSLEVLAAIAGPSPGARSHERFTRLLALAARIDDRDVRDDVYAAAGWFGPAELPVLLASDGAATWPALRTYLERRAMAPAAWAALLPKLPARVGALAPAQATELLGTVASLCDAPTIAAVTAALTAQLPRIADGRAPLDRALAVANRCVTRRQRASAGAF